MRENPKPGSRFRRFRDRYRRRPTSEEESLMRLLGLKSVEELDQWFNRDLSPEELLSLNQMKPPDEALDLAMKEAEEEEDEAERQEEIDQLTMERNARIKPQLLRRLCHLRANPKSDPEVYRVVVKIGMINFEDGAREFLKWSGLMAEDIGEPVRPILRDVWMRLPIEARREGERKLRDVAAKPEEIRKARERIKLFNEIERKSRGLVDATGREVELGGEGNARALKLSIPPPSRGSEAQQAANEVGAPPATKQKADSPFDAAREIPPEPCQTVPKESSAAGSLHIHTCPACGMYWTHQVRGYEPNQYCECENCRKQQISGEEAARTASSQADETDAKARTQRDALVSDDTSVLTRVFSDKTSGRCPMQGKDDEIVESMSAAYSQWARERRAEVHRKAVAADPNDSQAWCDLATDYRHLGQYDKAVEAYQRVVTIDPNRVLTWIGLGATYNDLKQYDKATEAHLRVVELEPKNAQAWFDLGLDYRKQGQQDKVTEVYRRLRPLDRHLAGCLLPWHVRLRRFVSKPEGKQLIVLSAAGMWVSALMMLELFSGIYRWSSALAALFFWSLPVLIFAGILFWWFGRNDRKGSARSDS